MTHVYEPVMGIEVHAQLNTHTKLFCGSSTAFGATPNAHVSPVCLGLPGALPVLNKRAVNLAIMAGLALDCTIKKTSVFSRKNYFYPDLPKGYQISQFDLPICEHGQLDISVSSGKKTIGITRIHMEEDAGKLVHAGADAIDGSTYSLVDLNRAGVPLIEIVSEPDIRTIEEARVYVETLRLIVQHLGICDGNMDEGSLRADVNISLRPVGSDTFGTRTEIKNLNSFRSLERAIASEIERQTQLLQSGQPVIQETRNYNDATQTTTALRSKEDAHDYRYFPEPDLPPLILTEDDITAAKHQMSELPVDKLNRYIQHYSIPETEAHVLIQDIEMNRYFERCMASQSASEPKEIAKWVMGPLAGILNDAQDSFTDSTLSPDRLLELLTHLQSGAISTKMAKELLGMMITSDAPVQTLIEQKGGSQISDQDELSQIVAQILVDNPDVVEKIRNGKTQSANFLMGQVMKATKGRAKPDLVRDMIISQATA